jgi:hypothetical protein
MQYMLLIYNNEEAHMKRTPEEFRAGMQAHQALMDETRKRGIFLGAAPLKPSTTAKTVTLGKDMRPFVTDGPFTETKEQLAGYYLLDCGTIEEALEYAKKIPQVCSANGRVGAVEVRPILEFAEIRQMLDTLVAEQHA